MTAADLNGDGVSDLAVASHNSAEVLVFLATNDGTGALGAAVSYRVGASPLGVVAEDLDGDGDIDLGASNPGSNSVTVLLNDGNGVFLLGGEYPTGPSPHAPASGDLDGDGAIDIITANFAASHVSILRNLGAGSFAAPVSFSTGISPIIAACGDLDGDGDLDLAAGNHGSASVSVLRNRGDGTFTPKVDVGVGLLPVGLVMTDLDGDRDLDLVTANYSSNTISLLRNDGTAVFAPQVTLGTGAGPLSVSAADLDLDGDSDLAVSWSIPGGGVSVFLNEGRGTFAAPLTRAVGSYPRWLTTGDLDGDGVPDVVTANAASNSISIVLNETTPSTSRDCNRNGVPDECDIASGVAEDCDASGVPDECELRVFPPRAGLVFWLNTESGLELDASGGVTRWIDQSGAGNDFTQAVAASRPAVVAGVGPGGRAVLQFDGVDDVLRNVQKLVSGDSFTLFTLMSVQEQGYPWGFGEEIGQPGARITYEGHPAGGVISTDFFDVARGSHYDARASLPGIGDSRFKVLSITGKASTSGIRVYADGVPATMSLTNPDAPLAFSAGNTLGGVPVAGTPKLYTRVAYVAAVLYDRALEPAEREVVEQILAQGGSSAPGGGDCNGNARPDDCDIADGTSQDCNEDGVPDECQTGVIDTGLPRLKLLGENPLSLECGTAYVEPGASAEDDCAGDLSSAVHTAGLVDPGTPGSYTRTYSVADPTGNEARTERTVVVRDSTAPELTCPLEVVVECTSAAGAVASFSVTATDNCDPAPRVTCVPPAGSTFRIGRSPVVCTATDAAGNVSECSFEVVVLESAPPAIQCPGTITVECTSAAGAPVGFSVTATDNCDPAPRVTCVPPAGSTFRIGRSPVQCTATDAAGNVSECSFEVVVLESAPPAIQCPGTITLECTSAAGAPVGFSVTATDNCDPAPRVTCVPPASSTFPVGTSVVVCTATDAAGNRSECTFQIVVTCGGGQLPGDCNQDGERDISDAICVLGYLFTGLPQRLPCGDGSDLDPANVQVFGWNSDGAIDLSDAVAMLAWQFLGGPEHVQGPECRRVPGCPDACAP